MKAAKNQTATIAAYAIPAELSAAIEMSESALQIRKSVDLAIERNCQDIKNSQASFDAACELQAQAETELALATTSRESIGVEEAATKAAEITEARRRELDRFQRVERALEAKASEADQKIVEARDVLNVEVGIFSGDALDAFAKEFRTAMLPLISVLAKGHALAIATRHRTLFHFFEGLKVPDPTDLYDSVPLVDTAGANINGRQSWAAIAQDGSIPSDFAATLQAIAGAEARLRAHAPFVPAHKKPAPYVVKGSGTGAGPDGSFRNR